jgi:hypothetical protein
MELAELQNLWTKQDETLKENVRLNREILRQLLQQKPEKRILWIKLHSIYELILPLILLPIFIPSMQFRDEFTFYLGATLFGAFCVITYCWAIRYFLLVMKIDFSSSIIILKRQIAELEKNKLRTKKIGFILFPFVLVGIFMMGGFRIHEFTFFSMLPLLFILVVFSASVYITFKYSIFERFRKLNREISELERLGKEEQED